MAKYHNKQPKDGNRSDLDIQSHSQRIDLCKQTEAVMDSRHGRVPRSNMKSVIMSWFWSKHAFLQSPASWGTRFKRLFSRRGAMCVPSSAHFFLWRRRWCSVAYAVAHFATSPR
jgi:hypothetical protein